jgi:hypothetical protein
METEALWKLYQEIGVGAFFAALYLSTVWVFIRDLQKQRTVQNESIERMIKAMDASTSATSNSTEVLKQVKTTIDANIAQTTEFMGYLKGRDRRRDE